MTTSKGMQAIGAERQSQIDRGYDEGHDALYTHNELLDAADAYQEAALGDMNMAVELWPNSWDLFRFRPNSKASSLAKAAALIAAEIDRGLATGEYKESDFAFPFEPSVRELVQNWRKVNDGKNTP